MLPDAYAAVKQQVCSKPGTRLGGLIGQHPSDAGASLANPGGGTYQNEQASSDRRRLC